MGHPSGQARLTLAVEGVDGGDRRSRSAGAARIGGAAGRAWRAGLSLALAAAVCLAAAAAARAEGEPSDRERLVRGALLYKFAKFVEWPGSLGDESAPVNICVVGDDAFASLVGAKVRSLTLQGHPVRVEPIVAETDAERCHVVYFSEGVDSVSWIARIGRLPILTVGCERDFLQAGGMIALVRRDESIGFEIDLEASRKAGLGLSARLLDVAVRVQNR